MTRPARLLLPLSLLLCAACAKPAAEADAAASAAAAAPAATPAATTPAAPAPAVDVPTETLTMAKVDAWLAATRNVADVVKANPALEDEVSMNASEEDTDAFVRRVQTHPEVVAAIAKAGITPREYATIGESLMAGLMTVGFMESGAIKEIPDGIDPALVEFVKQHKAELEAKTKALDAG